MLPLGQEEELDDLLAVYRQLPDRPFETLSAGKTVATTDERSPSTGAAEHASTQPVAIRTLSFSGRTYVYMVNDSPWKTSVRVAVDMPDCGVRSLNPIDRRAPALKGEGRQRTWTVALEPYGIFGAVFTAAGVKLSQPQVSLDDRVAAQLTEAIEDLYQRAAVLKAPPPLDVLQNAGFEQTSPKGVAGWEASPPNIKLDSQHPHSGKHAVTLTSEGKPASLVSAPFPAPRTGWLSVFVWLRKGDAAQQPALWLSLEGRLGSQNYIRKAPIGQGADAQPLTGEWARFQFEFPDLPTAGMSPLRLRFHLERAGDVWIDDIEMYDLEKLDHPKSLALAMSIQLAGLKLEKRQYADCLQLLEGYWPRYLTSNVQLTNHPVDHRPAPTPKAPASTATKPSMLDRLKNSFKR